MVTPVAWRGRPARMAAPGALAASSPSGESLWTIGPAKNRRTSMISRRVDQDPAALEAQPLISGPIRSPIQLSVPSSVVASGTMISSRTMNSGWPSERT